MLIFKPAALLIIALALTSICFSQNKTVIGVNVIGEYTSSSDFVVGLGGTLERQIKRHSGFETGLYYRTFEVRSEVLVDGSVYGFNFIKEKYLSIPILYKFYSPILQFSIGPSFDLYLGYKQSSKGLTFNSINYAPGAKLIVGLLGKVSKTITLTKKILLEPEIRYNPMLSKNRSFYGIGISSKFRLGK